MQITNPSPIKINFISCVLGGELVRVGRIELELSCVVLEGFHESFCGVQRCFINLNRSLYNTRWRISRKMAFNLFLRIILPIVLSLATDTLLLISQTHISSTTIDLLFQRLILRKFGNLQQWIHRNMLLQQQTLHSCIHLLSKNLSLIHRTIDQTDLTDRNLKSSFSWSLTVTRSFSFKTSSSSYSCVRWVWLIGLLDLSSLGRGLTIALILLILHF